MKLLSIIVAFALSACVPPPQQGWSSPNTAPSGGYGYQNNDPQAQGDYEQQASVDDEDGDQDSDDTQQPKTNAPQPTTHQQPAGPAQRRSITINGARLGPAQAQTLASLEATYRVTLPAGKYWYDPANGGFGIWGQPAAALLPAGLDLGPRLPANASNGTSGVYINNRQLQHGEVQFLSLLVGVQWQRGRYFIDAYGNAGLEGGAVLVNLVQVAQQRARAATGGGGGGRQDVHTTTGFGENQTQFFSSADGSCKSFNSSKGTIFVGC